ncbi:MAG TPA: NUDIX domain-containing protein [Acidimicrobiia bacterium]|jgi:8-oxo-dGTP pyrophosphatase MutT (NUDIX family)|nr:NUDIX domain-containing protein [Acidimicrobiia bacterium]
MTGSTPDLARLQREAQSAGRLCTAGAVVFDSEGRVFVPRRSPSARLPDLWDIVGGHVEPGESIEAALRREVAEETGWVVTGEPALVHVCEWELPEEPGRPRREFDFVVTVDGDLDRPRLAPAEHVDHMWVASDELDRLDENRGAAQQLVRRIVASAFAPRGDGGLRLPHATAFLDPVRADVEAVRRRWDPVMAAQIAAHVSVAYPSGGGDVDDLTARVAEVAPRHAPFVLELGAVVNDGDPALGIFVAVRDVEGGLARLRDGIADDGGRADVPPHVTLVHPRTSGLGVVAWSEVRALDLTGRFVVRSIAITAFDGCRWVTTSEQALG